MKVSVDTTSKTITIPSDGILFKDIEDFLKAFTGGGYKDWRIVGEVIYTYSYPIYTPCVPTVTQPTEPLEWTITCSNNTMEKEILSNSKSE